MHGWVECVPNFSEGQDEKLIGELEATVRAVPGVVFLRSDPSPDQNRTLFTFAGPGHSIRRAAFDLIRKAVERIDLTRHIGSHPRMGAVDVVPLVPLGTTTMEQASSFARDIGRDIGEKLGLPVFLYEESATRPERRSLADIRKGGFEGHLAGGFPVGAPDFGPAKPHPTAGSVAIGARFFLIALNLILDTNDLEVARSVARSVRESSRGLAAVRALGLPLTSQGLVQVSINILDHRATTMTQVMERAREEARRHGTTILGSELVGLVPRAAVETAIWELLRLPPQRRERVIEDAVENSGAFTFAERLAAATPTPGAGAAAARSGLNATSLLRMVSGIAGDRLKGASPSAELAAVRDDAAATGATFKSLEIRDEEAFDHFLSASREARRSGDGRHLVEAAAREATEVPLSMIEAAAATLELVARLLEIESKSGVALKAGSDLGGAIELSRAAARTAEMNIRVNLPGIERPAAEKYRARCDELMARFEPRADELRREVRKRYAS